LGNGPGKTGLWDKLAGSLKEAFLSHSSPLPLSPLTFATFMIERRYGPSINEGMRDFVRDVPWALTWLAADGAGGRLGWGHGSGDRQTATKVAHSIEEWWDSTITENKGYGKFEFRMGVGWKLPPGTLYNGKAPALDQVGKPIETFSAIFLKNKNGKVEVLDHSDPRYADIVGPYVATQVATALISGSAGGVLKTPSGATLLSRSVGATGKIVSGAEAASSIGYLANAAYSELSLKPESIQKMVQMLAHPETITLKSLREGMNTVFSEYSHPAGPMTEQYYIPSLGEKDNPLPRFHQVLMGRVRGAYEFPHPFAKAQARDVIRLGDAQEKILTAPEFVEAYYKTAEKALSGKVLSGADMVVLRAGLSYNQRYSGDLLDPRQMQAKFTPKDAAYQDMLVSLKEDMTARMGERFESSKNLAAKLKISYDPNDLYPSFREADMLAFSRNEREMLKMQMATAKNERNGPAAVGSSHIAPYMAP
jgi:hypothetical protein